jgi:hypothetical protein
VNAEETMRARVRTAWRRVAGSPTARRCVAPALAVVVAALASAGAAADRQGAPAGGGGPEAAGNAVRYVGAGACAAANCHGSAVPRTDSATSLQNEYLTWFKSDRHARAYAVLLEERSLAMARRLGMVDATADAATWLERTTRPERCLGCHAVDAPAAARGPKFDIADGVSCEGCHGPAGGWLTRHTEEGWTPAESIAHGMYDTMDPVAAARMCVSCHVGDGTRAVDHEMIAAGHPPLVFELDTFSANLPPHWAEHDGNRRWSGAGAWVAGQAIGLRASAAQLARQARAGGWPEFASYDCFACHHDLRQRSWWQARGSGGPPGRPSWDGSRYALLLHLARALAPEAAPALRDAVGRLERSAREARPPAEIAAAAQAAVTAADRVLEAAVRAPLDGERARALLRAIAADGQALALGGFRTAQQTAWGLDALALAHARAGGTAVEQTPARDAIGRLFGRLVDPADYDPFGFARELAAVRRQLP